MGCEVFAPTGMWGPAWTGSVEVSVPARIMVAATIDFVTVIIVFGLPSCEGTMTDGILRQIRNNALNLNGFLDHSRQNRLKFESKLNKILAKF